VRRQTSALCSGHRCEGSEFAWVALAEPNARVGAGDDSWNPGALQCRVRVAVALGGVGKSLASNY
jgi:hypothetical protein